MADTDGLVKLADASFHFRITWVFGCEVLKRRMQLSIMATDQDELSTVLDGFLDLATGETWVQLPINMVDDIVCQAGERAARAELDRRPIERNAQNLAAAGIQPAATGKRRATPSGCNWHYKRKSDRTKDHFDAEQCDCCYRWYKDTSAIVSMKISDPEPDPNPAGTVAVHLRKD